MMIEVKKNPIRKRETSDRKRHIRYCVKHLMLKRNFTLYENI